jgi:large subunit ribosomal protein L34
MGSTPDHYAISAQAELFWKRQKWKLGFKVQGDPKRNMAMASAKTLARAGSSLLGRFLASPSPSLLRAGLPPPSLLARIQPHVPPPPASVDAHDAGVVARLTSLPGEISFPCGLPSLRFLIDDGKASRPLHP